ncbi:MAG: cobyrinate a,c-diamide synthase [Pseudomonadota bacterium]|nr:cobyrinate a,c-diamide synthase [Pseudomonadota bacterium]
MAKGLIIAAPHSGSGKTLVTLGLLRALKNRGLKVISAKAGPDYIDPGFHAAATGQNCINLDYWAMGENAVRQMASAHVGGSELLIIEGVMGLFDGPQGAKGSTADLAEALGLPVILVVDASRQGQSIAALIEGFANHRPDVKIAGVILNRIASDRHEQILTEAINEKSLGALRQIDSLSLPSRHLGLVQAQENQQLEAFIELSAARVARETILDKIVESAADLTNHVDKWPRLAPLGQHIAIAQDAAFSFIYPHQLSDWHAMGTEISFFSPLADQAPPKADAIFLPGGYPELHAGKLADNRQFLTSLSAFKGLIYGECGGYMVLGDGLIDADGQRHAMAGLLPLTTSFAKRKLHLGYRQLKPLTGPWKHNLRGHEFHYSTIESHGGGEPLFHSSDAAGHDLGKIGQRVGNVMGSYAHIISVAPSS